MIYEVEKQRSALAELCQRYGVRQLQLFGSAATGAFIPETSDFDFIAEFTDTRSADYANRYLDFAEALERLFNRSVDVLTRGSIRNPYFRVEIERTAQIIYEDHAQEAAA
jgi:predicted nucleotidyltransferase